VLGLFSNFSVAFTYLSPIVGVFSLFVLGAGSGGPAYVWTTWLPVAGPVIQTRPRSRALSRPVPIARRSAGAAAVTGASPGLPRHRYRGTRGWAERDREGFVALSRH